MSPERGQPKTEPSLGIIQNLSTHPTCLDEPSHSTTSIYILYYLLRCLLRCTVFTTVATVHFDRFEWDYIMASYLFDNELFS